MAKSPRNSSAKSWKTGDCCDRKTMNSREVICHPGPETYPRIVSARGAFTTHCLKFKKNHKLLDTVKLMMNDLGCDSAVMLLDGMNIGPFDYVIPSYADDSVHAAWYSKTHTCQSASIRHGTATIGRRDGEWWLHCHAVWNTGDSMGMGHLLPDSVMLSTDSSATFYAFSGGYFDFQQDPETDFPIFHVNGHCSYGNGMIARINPHEDIYSALQALVQSSGFLATQIYGIGSVIGAQFELGVPMECPISEVLILPGASAAGKSLKLPLYCVDTDNRHFHGHVLPDTAPVLVTFEVMIIETPDSKLESEPVDGALHQATL